MSQCLQVKPRGVYSEATTLYLCCLWYGLYRVCLFLWGKGDEAGTQAPVSHSLMEIHVLCSRILILGDNLEIAIKHNAQIIKHFIEKQKLLFSPTLVTPCTAASQAPCLSPSLLSLLKFMCIVSMMPSNHQHGQQIKGQTNHRKGPIGKQIKNLCPRMPLK